MILLLEKRNDELLFLFENYSLSFKFFINQFRFRKILPAFPAGQGNFLSLTQAGPGGEILGPAVRTGKNFAHNRYWLLVTGCLFRVARYWLGGTRSQLRFAGIK